MSDHKYTNHLIHETSPYLLQHAHNPVEWYAWGETALQKAKAEEKPILVSIGYAACHWCHVMERESFENEETAAFMNRHFVNIKIDREERPDLDHIYMDAVQAISGGGGWPLNVFLLPDGRPFYGGTYYPPVRAFNRMSWPELLSAIHDMFSEKRNEVESQADNLLHHLSAAASFIQSKENTSGFQESDLETINENLLQAADTTWGGFGQAPKFPQTFSIQYLLRHYYFTGNESSVKQALLSLDCLIGGGIYDQLGGGFARYSTDGKWLAPHFEKMLYDNALILSTLSEAYQLTQKPLYADAIKQTLEFIEREMQSPEGGWYSALDADSEGIEGKFYTWQKEEIENMLGEEDASFFCDLFDVTDEGNWEHINILWLSHSENWQNKIAGDDAKQRLEQCRRKLLSVREKRIRPGLDDKIILGWNALMIVACCKAYAALGDDTFLKMADRNLKFLYENLLKDGVWQHSWKEARANHPAFLDDYAYLIWAHLQLQEVTGKADYLVQAKEIAGYVLDHFSSTDSSLFYYTPQQQNDVVIRKTEVYDGATPSGNSVMAMNLHYLSLVFDNSEWRQRAQNMVASLHSALVKYPTSFGVWAMAYQQMIKGTNEIVVVGEKAMNYLKEIQSHFIANKVVQSATTKLQDDRFVLLNNRFRDDKTLLYICKEGICGAPVENVEEALGQLA